MLNTEFEPYSWGSLPSAICHSNLASKPTIISAIIKAMPKLTLDASGN
jgi:hypothetical protein